MLNNIGVLVQTLVKLITLVNVEEREGTMEDAAAEVAIMMNNIGVLVQTLVKLITLVIVEEGEGTMEDAAAKVAIENGFVPTILLFSILLFFKCPVSI